MINNNQCCKKSGLLNNPIFTDLRGCFCGIFEGQNSRVLRGFLNENPSSYARHVCCWITEGKPEFAA